MRQLKIIEHMSLDGVIQHSAEGDGFPYGDWTAPFRSPAGRDAVTAAHGESFDLLLGRRTYDIWSGFWPKAPSSPIGDRLNAATKYVATHRPESLEWGPFEGIGPDLIGSIRRIKSQHGRNLILSGSSTLILKVLAQGLSDEVVLIVYPTLLGTGKRLFAQGTPARLFELVSTNATATGVLLCTYRAAGPLKTGEPATADAWHDPRHPLAQEGRGDTTDWGGADRTECAGVRAVPSARENRSGTWMPCRPAISFRSALNQGLQPGPAS